MLTEALLQELDRLVNDVGEPSSDDRSDPRVLGLPEAHIELLRRYNGFSVSGGTYRVLGRRQGGSLDLLAWNEPNGWKKAWKGRADLYFCFGMSAFGDQWAYRIIDQDALSAEVYQLYCSTFEEDLVAYSFEEFVELELLEVAREPFDAMLVRALNELGPIGPSDLWVFSPSPLLGGPETVEQILTMPAVAAMSVAGQIATALEGAGMPDL